MINVAIIANSIGGVKTPPYSTIGKGDVGGDACIAPQAGARPSGPMTSIGPYSMGVEEFRPQRGQSGKREKSVKKNAALLHFLGFFPLTLLFGVLRGERLAAKTMAASLLRKPARAVIRPAGANIARSPVSLRSTVAPCSQPRNPLGRASRAFASSGHLFRFLFGCPKRKA